MNTMSADEAISFDSRYGQGPDDRPRETKSSMSKGSALTSGCRLMKLSTSLPLHYSVSFKVKMVCPA